MGPVTRGHSLAMGLVTSGHGPSASAMGPVTRSHNLARGASASAMGPVTRGHKVAQGPCAPLSSLAAPGVSNILEKSGNQCFPDFARIPQEVACAPQQGLGSFRSARHKGTWVKKLLIILRTHLQPTLASLPHARARRCSHPLYPAHPATLCRGLLI